MMAAIGWERLDIGKNVGRQQLEGIVCRHPFADREILGYFRRTRHTGRWYRMRAYGARVTGKKTFKSGKKYGLADLSPSMTKRIFTEGAPGFEGMFYDKANKKITAKAA